MPEICAIRNTLPATSRSLRRFTSNGRSDKAFSAATYPTGLVAYDSRSKKKIPLLSKENGIITWYICGPTVYDDSHLGHAWCYVNFDIIRKVMENHFGLNVIQVMNITDIDDKIINKAEKQKVDFKDISSFYEAEFLNDLSSLGVENPTLLTKVSDYIPQILCFIEKLLNEGLAYTTEDGSVYFNLKAYSDKNFLYGKLKPSDSLKSSDGGKKFSNDFALWKAAKFSSEPSWKSSWGGMGRPGWHIECSTMASCIFGTWLDLHSGGIDLLFPHHENEEAQCCAYHDVKQWVGHWIHTGHLNLPNGVKMSKSLKNFITIKEFLEHHSADQFRMLCLISNYRNDLELSEASLALAQDLLDSVRIFCMDCSKFIRNHAGTSSIDYVRLLTELSQTQRNVKEYLSDDFNTAQATKCIRQLISVTRSEMTRIENNVKSDETLHVLSGSGIGAMASVLNFVLKYFSSLGFNLTEGLFSHSGMDINSIIDDVVEFRRDVRQLALSLKPAQHVNADCHGFDAINTKKTLMASCDKLRHNLKLKGIQIKDRQSCSSSWTLAR